MPYDLDFPPRLGKNLVAVDHIINNIADGKVPTGQDIPIVDFRQLITDGLKQNDLSSHQNSVRDITRRLSVDGIISKGSIKESIRINSADKESVAESLRLRDIGVENVIHVRKSSTLHAEHYLFLDSVQKKMGASTSSLDFAQTERYFLTKVAQSVGMGDTAIDMQESWGILKLVIAQATLPWDQSIANEYDNYYSAMLFGFGHRDSAVTQEHYLQASVLTRQRLGLPAR